MNKKQTFKRALAFIIDIFLITIISGMFAEIEFINPYIGEYENISEEYLSYVSEITDPTQIANDEKYNNYIYEMSYYGVYSSIITLVITILYFVVFQFYNNGKTIGKAILKIKVVSSDKKLKITNFLFRSLIVNSLLTSIVLIISILCFSKAKYLEISEVVQIIDIGLLFLCVGLMIYRDDGRGLHDLIAKTNVISVEDVNEAVVSYKTNKKGGNKK